MKTWLEVWHELVVNNRSDRQKSKRIEISIGVDGRPDPLMEYALQNIRKTDKVLDIGAGMGRWTLPLAQKAARVTAIDPSEKMLERLRENIRAGDFTNIQVLQSRWEETAGLAPHDIAICAHGIYSSPDFAAYIRKMEALSVRECYLELRIPAADGVIGELSQKIGRGFHDSPNAVVAMNALYEMGIYPRVMMVEENSLPWEDDSLDAALEKARGYLHLDNEEYDDLLRTTLSARLEHREGRYFWPDGMRSALIQWKPSSL